MPDPIYAEQSTVTDPGTMTELVEKAIPPRQGHGNQKRTVDTIRRIANGLAIHYRDPALSNYGIPEQRLQEINTRYADLMFARISELDPHPLANERTPTTRFIGCCRDFTVLTLSLLRQAG